MHSSVHRSRISPWPLLVPCGVILAVVLLPGTSQAQWINCTSGPAAGSQTCTSSPAVGIGEQNPGTFGTLEVANGNNGSVAVTNNTIGAWIFRKIRSDGSNGMGIYDPSGFGQMSLYTAGSERIRIDQSGNVGIGTTSPQHLLHVAGTIGAEEVIVSSNGADYVFEPEYKLEPLADVAKFVAEKHHLPDIPSAEEMKEEGLSVGEMQAKLLAKIEELTLHAIQSEKENRELRERLERMEARLAAQVEAQVKAERK